MNVQSLHNVAAQLHSQETHSKRTKKSDLSEDRISRLLKAYTIASHDPKLFEELIGDFSVLRVASESDDAEAIDKDGYQVVTTDTITAVFPFRKDTKRRYTQMS
jgi:hypothetical protein